MNSNRDTLQKSALIDPSMDHRIDMLCLAIVVAME
jgi:hypothetical protein